MISTTEISEALAGWEKNPSVFSEQHFEQRADILEQIDSHLDLAEQDPPGSRETDQLYGRIRLLKDRLETVDRNLFRRLRDEIRDKGLRKSAFKGLVNGYVRSNSGEQGYDNLDLFINGLFSGLPVPEPLLERELGMVYYQKTPARIVFEMAESLDAGAEDIFVDIGCGLGQATILMQLLTGITSTGIEFEPSYCQYARACAAALGLPEMRFINENALAADYSKPTIFFLYTPFVGDMMRQVLGLLRKQALNRIVRVFSYGPCSVEMGKQDWLQWIAGNCAHSDALCSFVSNPS